MGWGIVAFEDVLDVRMEWDGKERGEGKLVCLDRR